MPIDLRMHEQLRAAEIEIGRLRTEIREAATIIAGLRGIVIGQKANIARLERMLSAKGDLFGLPGDPLPMDGPGAQLGPDDAWVESVRKELLDRVVDLTAPGGVTLADVQPDTPETVKAKCIQARSVIDRLRKGEL